MIAVFGASVTQQKPGFAYELKKLFAKEKVCVFGFGGMHLDDAGICFVDQVANHHPRICFVDWFSTGYTKVCAETKEYIDTILYKLTVVKCKPVFLFLARKEKQEEFYHFCKTHLKTKNIAFVEVNELVASEPTEKILRDNIHTTEFGAKIYAQIIFNWYKKNYQKVICPKICATRFCQINVKKVNRIFFDKILLSVAPPVYFTNLYTRIKQQQFKHP